MSFLLTRICKLDLAILILWLARIASIVFRCWHMHLQVCAPGCQALIDKLYIDCDGVTSPDGLYYDPNNAIEGTWSDRVRADSKVRTRRSGRVEFMPSIVRHCARLR